MRRVQRDDDRSHHSVSGIQRAGGRVLSGKNVDAGRKDKSPVAADTVLVLAVFAVRRAESLVFDIGSCGCYGRRFNFIGSLALTPAV